MVKDGMLKLATINKQLVVDMTIDSGCSGKVQGILSINALVWTSTYFN